MKKFFVDLVTFSGTSFLLSFFLAVSLFLEGIVLYYLWEWFVVPLGMPQLKFWHALGLGLLVHYLTYHYYDFKKNDEAGIYEPFCYLFIRPVATLGLGWCINYVSAL